MNILSKLWSACNALATALDGLAATVNEIRDGLRQRVGLDVASTPALGHDNATETPALVSNGRRGKKSVVAE